MLNNYWIIPLSPIVFGTGISFGSTDTAKTRAFPSPSTIAGAVREAAKSNGIADPHSYAVHGALLHEQNIAHKQTTLFLPTPTDLEFFPKKVIVLQPQPKNQQQGYDNQLHQQLQLVQLAEKANNKPIPRPQYFRLASYIEWLCGHKIQEGWGQQPERYFLGNLPLSTRNHVSIDLARQSSKEGDLFRTQGIDYSPRFAWQAESSHERAETLLNGGCHYRLLVRTELSARSGLLRLGGRSRLAYLQPTQGYWPNQCPQVLTNRLARTSGVRLILATPAIFNKGWLPSWLDEQTLQGQIPGIDGIHLTLKAVSLGDWEAISMRTSHGQRSALKRMVPAGSVYWFEVKGNLRQLAFLWLYPLSDQAIDRNDGFGLCLPGVWAFDESSAST